MYVLGYSGFTRNARSADGFRNPFGKTRQDFPALFRFQDGEVPFPLFPLGFFGHDASAALLRDGELVACAAEERFTRAKYALNLAGNTLLPRNAIRYCLDEAGIGIDDVDVVAHYCRFDSESVQRRLRLVTADVPAEDAQRVAQSYHRVFSEMMNLPVLLEHFESMTGSRPRRFVQVPHHLAHAASAYHASGFDEALVCTIDGTGETESALLAEGRNGRIVERERTLLPDSLGTLYLLVTVLLGFRSLGDEYKVMGLAGYGDPARFRPFFDGLLRLLPDGRHTLDGFTRPDLRERMERGLCVPRPRGADITQEHCDVAAALQEGLERAVLHTLAHARKRSGLTRLCMAGGVALNSMMNGAIARAGLFDDIFIQPAAGDEGGGLGAALHAWHESANGHAHGTTLTHVYYGPAYGEEDILAALLAERARLQWTHSDHVAEETAEALASGMVVGWFQDRMEFGPRALGNRSILSDPRPPNMKDRINEKVKHREGFRPFAPAVPEEDAATYFDMHGLARSPYMLFVVPVRERYRETLPAITHVDGSARVQTVCRDSNPKFWNLLRAFERHSGMPVLLNTSFNVMHEPIVCSPADAVRCFLRTDIDLLVLGDYIVRRKADEGAA